MRTIAPRNSLDCLTFGAHAGDVDIRLHDTADEFRAIAEPLYRRDPIRNTIELTLLCAGVFPGDSLFLTVWHHGAPVGAALQTPPYPLACNAIPVDLVKAVAAELARLRPRLDGVRGMRDNALAFASAWHDVTGRPGIVTVEERLYRLDTLQPPNDVSGSPRLATDDDRAVLVDWVELFFGETFGHLAKTTQARSSSAPRNRRATGLCCGPSTVRR